MSCCWTVCLDCETFINHQIVSVCPKCGSTNVETDVDPDELRDEEE